MIHKKVIQEICGKIMFCIHLYFISIQEKMVQIHKSAVVLSSEMQSISVFLDTTKVSDFWWKNADASRNHGLCHKIYLFLGSSLGKVQLWQVSSL